MTQNKMVQPGTRRCQEEGWAGKKSKRKDCGKIREIGDFSSIDLYKKEMMLEEDLSRSKCNI
jgi:hypothetical protein